VGYVLGFFEKSPPHYVSVNRFRMSFAYIVIDIVTEIIVSHAADAIADDGGNQKT